MQKISKAGKTLASFQASEPDERSGRISGAIYTSSWPGAAPLDFSSLSPARKPHTTVDGTMSISDCPESGSLPATVALSDGTRITFVDSNSIVDAD
jgi:hypothetical protein